MADYTINVNVDVDEGELKALEARIDSLKKEEVTVNVKTNLSNMKTLSKDIKTAIEAAERSIAQSHKKNKTSLFKDLFNPDSIDYSSIAKAAKNIKDLIGNDLNLGQVNLTVNQAIFTELNQLESKLKDIKTLAKNMGSIKLSVADDISLQDGKITIGRDPVKGKSTTYANQLKELKLIAKAQASNEHRRKLDNADISALDKESDSLARQKQAILDNIGKTGDTAKAINANDEFNKVLEKARKDNEKALKSLSSSNDAFEKEYNKMSENLKKFQHQLDVSGTKNSPLDKKLVEGYTERLKHYTTTLNEVDTLQKEVASLDPNIDSARIAEAKAELDSFASYARKQEKVLSNISQFYKKEDTQYYQQRYLGLDVDLASTDIQNNMDDMLATFARGSKYSREYDASTGKMTATVERASGVIEKYALKYNQNSGLIEGSLAKISQHVKPLSSYISELGSKFKSLSQYLISNFGFEVFQLGVTEGIKSIRELDTAMTELKKTSEGTSEQYRNFTKQANIDAKAIGSTTTQLTNSAADYSRLGYTLEESATLAKTTGILKNVSEFEDINAASEAMISMMKAFDVEADRSMDLVDKMNLIGNNYAISTDGIATSLQTSASALVAAGNDFDKSVALVTAAMTKNGCIYRNIYIEYI